MGAKPISLKDLLACIPSTIPFVLMYDDKVQVPGDTSPDIINKLVADIQPICLPDGRVGFGITVTDTLVSISSILGMLGGMLGGNQE